jgi:signal peptide peptidase SppA
MGLLSRLPFLGRGDGPLVTVLPLRGVIGGGRGLLAQGLSMEKLARPIAAAFAPKRLAAVALLVNSPGGSPVQSSLIARRIRDLADEKKVPVYAFVEDVAASGGYWLACAGDEIWVDDSSIVGSIGVISSGFGFQDAIARIGVERRMHTAGTRKSILDPFQPERPEDVAKLEELQRDIHAAFIAHIRARRGGRLTADDATLFTGEFWTGAKGRALGLADGIGHAHAVLRAKFGPKVRLRLVQQQTGWLRRLTRADSLAAAAVDSAVGAVEDRLLWSRYGM